MELLLALDDGGGSLRQRLVEGVRGAIAEGRLTEGQVLPSSRTLAQELGCSRWSVNEAYVQLGAEGWLHLAQGSGTTVAAGAGAASAAAARPPAPVPAAPVLADLRPGLVDPAEFPVAAWSRVLRKGLAGAGRQEMSDPAARGTAELRRVLAAYLARVRGIRSEPDEILVTCGAMHGVALLSRVLAASGRSRLAVEDPAWRRPAHVAAANGLTVRAVPVDGLGLRVDALGDADAAICSPAHQFPTGTVLAPERRRALLAWAAGGGRLVVEDDYDAEFRYDRKPVAALAAMDRSDVAYVGSTSKTLSPALRLGWLVPPPRLYAAVADALDTATSGPSVLDQLAFAAMLEEGAYDRHLRRSRVEYRRRRDALVSALGSELPQVPVLGAAAGLHLVLPLPADVDEGAVVAGLAARGVAVSALGSYSRSGTGAGLVLGYGRLAPSRIGWAVGQVRAVLGR